MGLLQRAIETYDCNAQRAGKLFADEKEPLSPVSHMIAKAEIEITVDQDGNFISASAVGKQDEKTVIPVTEGSAGRSGTKAYMRPHPLCDKISYLSAEENYYLPQLESWANSSFSHPKLLAILRYLKRKSIAQDLKDYDLSKDPFIRWIVVGLGDQSGPCWTDTSLQDAYIRYSQATREGAPVLCMVTGEYTQPAVQHAKGIVALNGNAKLISSNDSSGFTYRGRFTDEQQAATVSYMASQKAHNALRWLIANQGVIYGGRTFLCWNPQGIRVGSPARSFVEGAAVQTKPSDYRDQLAAVLASRKKELGFQGKEPAIVAVFDAATTGRLALTYYNELSLSGFLDRMYDWDQHCCWWNGPYGIQAPSLYQLIKCAFGAQRAEKGTIDLVTDDRIMKQELQSLLACRLSEGRFPEHIRTALILRAGTPQAYEAGIWRSILYAACAAINMTTFQKKGVDTMSWELDKQDRSFQFGRLLAAMEQAEEDYYYLSGETGRQTNAMKMMSVFRQRPWSTYEQINRQLNTAYLPRLKPWQRTRYQRLKGEIVTILSTFPEAELNRPLSELYLMGYDLQHREFFKKHDDMEEEQ